LEAARVRGQGYELGDVENKELNVYEETRVHALNSLVELARLAAGMHTPYAVTLFWIILTNPRSIRRGEGGNFQTARHGGTERGGKRRSVAASGVASAATNQFAFDDRHVLNAIYTRS
jgi:hypothetical protein